jgi:hypothetical protein
MHMSQLPLNSDFSVTELAQMEAVEYIYIYIYIHIFDVNTFNQTES